MEGVRGVVDEMEEHFAVEGVGAEVVEFDAFWGGTVDVH